MFVVAISEYNLKCYEDDKTNRLQESLALFDDVCNGEWFNKTPIMLVFNKIDLFQSKLTNDPLKNYFEDYEGGEDFEKAIKYLEKQFRNLNRFDQNRIHIFHINAIDSSSVSNMMKSIVDLIDINDKN
jgi:guanine nucleotide-binding protein G(i) subunit alpha